MSGGDAPIPRGDVEDHVRRLGEECYEGGGSPGRRLTPAGVGAALTVLPGWRAVSDAGALERRFPCRGLGDALLLLEHAAAAMSVRAHGERLTVELDEEGVTVEVAGPDRSVTLDAVDLAGELNETYGWRGQTEETLEPPALERLLELVPHWRLEAGALMRREFLFTGEAPALWFIGRALGAASFAQGEPRVGLRFAGRSVEIRLKPRHAEAVTSGQIEAAAAIEQLAEDGGDGENQPRTAPLGDRLDDALGWRGPWGTPGALHALLRPRGAPGDRALKPRAADPAAASACGEAGPRNGGAFVPLGGSRESSR